MHRDGKKRRDRKSVKTPPQQVAIDFEQKSAGEYHHQDQQSGPSHGETKTLALDIERRPSPLLRHQQGVEQHATIGCQAHIAMQGIEHFQSAH